MNDQDKYEYAILDEDFENSYEEEDISWIDKE